VAGIHRLLARIDHVRSFDIVVVVAGWDAALASVMGGLTGQPAIAVPTSTGYGVAAGGHSALHSMLTSCGQGVLVTNIDNGFGAACGAIRMLGLMAGKAA
jgi:NCAIR mutase (PurE)-related protein